MPDAMVAARASEETGSARTQAVDVAVVGAGFAGLYLLHRLRKAGFMTVALEEADDVGGTWYWNRYPGARCDIQTIDYSYTFDPELETRLEVVGEIRHPARNPALPRLRRRPLRSAARHPLWHQGHGGDVGSGARNAGCLLPINGAAVSCRYYIMATGCLSSPKPPEIDGVKDFNGEVYFTGRWPHDEVKLAGKRVAVIGTGSSGIQSIPLIAEQAAQLTVFQRTPNFALPAHNGPAPADRAALLEGDSATYREQARWSLAGVPLPQQTEVSWQLSDAERRERFEKAWAAGDLVYMLTQLWADQGVDVDGNALLADLFREKDPQRSSRILRRPQALSPHDHPFGAKRPCLDTNYYATYNRPNVTLVNLRQEPIKAITASGIKTDKRNFDVDVIVFATGFDAMTGAIMAVHPITGRGGKSLSDVWAHGPQTYLGLTVAGLSQFVHDHRSRQPVGAVEHGGLDRAACRLGGRPVDRDARSRLHHDRGDRDGAGRLGAAHGRLRDADAASAGQHLVHGRQRPRQAAGRDALYRRRRSLPQHLQRGRRQGHAGLQAHGPRRCRAMQRRRDRSPAAGRPAGAKHAGGNEAAGDRSRSGAQGARAFVTEFNAGRPAGRPVGEVVDGTLPGADGPLAYRLYRPATPGPHPIVVYFHGGGWVLGDEQSDDPFCRDMCRRSGMIFVSVGYRHAPEHRFPAAAEDG